MKKYIKPAVEQKQLLTGAMLTQTSLPLGGNEVDGGDALGKNAIWGDVE